MSEGFAHSRDPQSRAQRLFLLPISNHNGLASHLETTKAKHTDLYEK